MTLDAVDDDAGHGTHCTASVAGNCEYGSSSSMSKYNGMAYNAKVAFFDIGVTGTNELNPPLYLDSEMFLPMYNAGARIFSNSWGAPQDNTYNFFANSVDKFMHNYPDALVLFAAGTSTHNTYNIGQKTLNQSITQSLTHPHSIHARLPVVAGNDGPYPYSVDAPSTNKNGLSVGASLTDGPYSVSSSSSPDTPPSSSGDDDSEVGDPHTPRRTQETTHPLRHGSLRGKQKLGLKQGQQRLEGESRSPRSGTTGDGSSSRSVTTTDGGNEEDASSSISTSGGGVSSAAY